MPENESKVVKVSRWFHIALMAAFVNYLGMFIAGLAMYKSEYHNYFIAGIMMAVSALVGAVGTVLVARQRKWSGLLLAAIPVAASVIGLARLHMLYDDFAPIVIFFVLPFLLTVSVFPLAKSDERAGSFELYPPLLTVAVFGQIALSVLPWLKLPNDVHGYTVDDIMNLEDVLWRISDAVVIPKAFLWFSLGAIALTVFFQLVEIFKFFTNKPIGSGLMKAASRCALAECAGVLCMFVAMWLCVFSGIYPSPWLTIILFSTACQLMLAKRIKMAALAID